MGLKGYMDWKGRPINKERHGGVRAASFTYFLVTMTSTAYVPVSLNLVTYLHDTMHMGVASASTTVTNFIGGSCAFALLGAFVSDSYITRFKTILIFAPFAVLGFGLLALQAHLPSLRPPSCDTSGPSSNCKEVYGSKAAILFLGLYIYALGEGCLRATVASLGGDQFDDDDAEELKSKASFFNWFAFGISLGSFIGLILLVWVQNNKGWDYGFGVCALIELLGLTVLASGFSLYRNMKPEGSPLTRMLQVIVVAFKNRKASVSGDADELHKKHSIEDATSCAEELPHTKGYKFLDKAAVVQEKTGDWSLCTVTKVEETKIMLRMLPIFISSVFSYTPIFVLLTLSVQQGTTMNTKIGKIHVSPATLVAIPGIFQMVVLFVYDWWFVPMARKITGYTGGITQLQRVGVGFLSLIAATSVAALVEMKRKRVVEEHGLVDTSAGVPMSVLWLGLQFFVVGISDATSFVGLLEFFNGEVSMGMKSIGTAIFWCTLGLSSLMGSVLIDIVNSATGGRNGRMGWLEGSNLNSSNSHLDRFYWLLSGLGIVGFLNYLYWAKNYMYRQNPRVSVL